jgi:hypothetical protein
MACTLQDQGSCQGTSFPAPTLEVQPPARLVISWDLEGPTSLRWLRSNPFPQGQAKRSSPSRLGEVEPTPLSLGKVGLLSHWSVEAVLASLGSGEAEPVLWWSSEVARALLSGGLTAAMRQP